jgi:Tfp pilus assembly major pilin PilA
MAANAGIMRREPATRTMNRHRQRGFGLGLHGSFADMLVPLGIVAIITVIAVPQFLEYRARSRIAAALKSADPARAAVAKAFAKGPADMSQSAVTGWNAPPPAEYLESLSVRRDGAIVLRFTDGVAPPGENELQIVPVSAGRALDLSQPSSSGQAFEWQCGGAAGRSTVPPKLRPEGCR